MIALPVNKNNLDKSENNPEKNPEKNINPPKETIFYILTIYVENKKRQAKLVYFLNISPISNGIFV